MHGAFAASARLYEAISSRLHQPEDAYEAARAEAQGGRPERAIDLLRRAVEAGFSDRARGLVRRRAGDAARDPRPRGGAAPAVTVGGGAPVPCPAAMHARAATSKCRLPRYQTEGAAGMDLHAALAAPLTLAPGDRALVPTGWAVAIPPASRARCALAPGWRCATG